MINACYRMSCTQDRALRSAMAVDLTVDMTPE